MASAVARGRSPHPSPAAIPTPHTYSHPRIPASSPNPHLSIAHDLHAHNPFAHAISSPLQLIKPNLLIHLPSPRNTTMKVISCFAILFLLSASGAAASMSEAESRSALPAVIRAGSRKEAGADGVVRVTEDEVGVHKRGFGGKAFFPGCIPAELCLRKRFLCFKVCTNGFPEPAKCPIKCMNRVAPDSSLSTILPSRTGLVQGSYLKPKLDAICASFELNPKGRGGVGVGRRRPSTRPRPRPMLQMRLSKVSTGGGGGSEAPPPPPPLVDAVTVACPEHLVIADLPVAKTIGAVTFSAAYRTFGRRSQRKIGKRVHFCVRCDLPISPSKAACCNERIQKIQSIKMMEGIFICAAPHCYKSFLKQSELGSHISEAHHDLLQSNTKKEDDNDEAKQLFPQEISTAHTLPKPGFSPSMNSQQQDCQHQYTDHPPFYSARAFEANTRQF
ncbi:hypothetical protein Cni_G03543 [Canna indica]|uniref:C2H2-type domain-containing protein n=1 Tax=Canna indica TaxID=4628 RepID=A0AAQ3Q1W4_9LILI|nr:hypothetical protein Cni_G03543 [Canna indica]